ncbi:MAG: hypothetical protein IJS08_10715 [Victivallales bacterium]|nr:hypothetical protein [Victivallales bacterium]
MKIEFKANGVIKPMHSVGQPPTIGICDYKLFHYLKEIGVKYSRLHDVGGSFGRGIYVDIPNLFRDFDANPFAPANYDFTFTDLLLQALVDNDIEPYFRLGVTIENAAKIKAYRIYPPKDNLQWARICEGVIRHYTEGWGNGFKMKITHWEIWNEPENKEDPLENQMWRGTFQQYMELYKTASTYLKERFPHLMIGGYGSCGLYAKTKVYLNGSAPRDSRIEYLADCFEKFVDFISKNKCPLDFFSFHYYDKFDRIGEPIEYVRKVLDKAGFKKTELSLNEWKPTGDEIDSPQQAAHIAAALLIIQDSSLDDAEIYDARCGMGAYSPLFNPITYQPRRGYYALKAFNELYKRGKALKVTGLPKGVYGVGAKGKKDIALMLANCSGKTQKINLDNIKSCLLLDETHNLEDVPVPSVIEDNAVMLLTLA